MTKAESNIKEYKKAIKQNIEKKMKIMTRINIIFFVIAIILFILRLNFVVEAFTIIFSGLLIIGLIVQFALYKTTPTKPLYNVLYQAIAEDINQDDDNPYMITYESLVSDKEVVQKGGLFTKYSTKEIKYHIEIHGIVIIDLYHFYIYTQSDKSRVTHFDGLYTVMPIPSEINLQLRDRSKPKNKNIKFERVDDYKEARVFIEKGISQNIPPKMMNLFDIVSKYYSMYDIYVAGLSDEVHIAVHKGNLPKKVSNLTPAKYEDLKQQMLKQINFMQNLYDQIMEY